MSYDKLKSLVANVEAIETAMKIKVQGRTATQEEKAVLSRYSGFGGIKEVLNIGTDRPIGGNMDEPVRRLQELIDAYPYFTEPMRQAVTESIKVCPDRFLHTENHCRCGGKADTRHVPTKRSANALVSRTVRRNWRFPARSHAGHV